MSKVYHLDLTKRDISGATVALMPGDPFRCGKIADEITKIHGGSSRQIAWKREFCTHLVTLKNKLKLLVTSTGIGGPSTSIATDELARLGVKTFIRVGTTGAIQRRITAGHVVITTGSVRLDGASKDYAPVEFPAVADLSVTNALVSGAMDAGVKYHTGVTASSDTFYPGEERGDSYRDYTIRRLRGSTKEWIKLGVLNYEMESATLLTMTASMGLRGGCITGVVNRGGTGNVTKKNLALGERNVIKAAAMSIKYLKD